MEVTVGTNPLNADSNGNGVNNLADLRAHLDPKFSPTNGGLPFYRSAPGRWEWLLDNVQIVWNHNQGALGMELRYSLGGLSYLFHSENAGGFSAPSNAGGGIWEADYGSPPADLRAVLGFSGFGAVDLSDRLRFRLFAPRAAASRIITPMASTSSRRLRAARCAARINCGSVWRLR